MNGELIITDDVPGVFASTFVDALAQSNSPRHCVALSGGDTARACYERLVGDDRVDQIDWSSVDFYWGDERCVSCTSADSNQRLARESLLEHLVQIRGAFPMACASKPGGGLSPQSYQLLIERVPEFDVVHLGMGPDGHTASLFAGSEALHAPPDVLVLETEDPTRRMAHPRITLTLNALTKARLAIFTVSGSSKRDAMQALLAGEDIPAGRVQAGRIVWIADAEACPP
ncbi:MAG: 6-phosphogluconolactonase [Acidimicrobiales bacterium]